jgi:membrane protease YdiL (CAAX protease family)
MSSRRTLIWILWAASALVTIGLFFVPAFIIRPFTHQSTRGLAVAMAVRQRAPLGTLLAALLFVALTLVLWNAVGLWRKIGLGLVVVLVAFSTVMARLNYFEWMFHPVANAQFENEADSKLASSEMILALKLGSDARAYPISQMAYHHILNDVVDGVPVAVTY